MPTKMETKFMYIKLYFHLCCNNFGSVLNDCTHMYKYIYIYKYVLSRGGVSLAVMAWFSPDSVCRSHHCSGRAEPARYRRRGRAEAYILWSPLTGWKAHGWEACLDPQIRTGPVASSLSQLSYSSGSTSIDRCYAAHCKCNNVMTASLNYMTDN